MKTPLARIHKRHETTRDVVNRNINEVFMSLAQVVRLALDEHGLGEPLDLYWSGSLKGYHRQLPNHQHLSITDGLLPPEPPETDVKWAGVTLKLREPHDAEEVAVRNVISFGEEAYPLRPGRPDEVWAHHDTLDQLREGLSEQLSFALRDPQMLYGAYALALFESQVPAAA